MSIPSVDNTSVVNAAGQWTNLYRIIVTDSIGNAN